ncbi:hypothetical protein BCD49_35960 [Pseudofrankia sp. EUN1h]|nr:hypothetical protein BCD49_35960 [Pseudofrankia sp. EUN1h]
MIASSVLPWSRSGEFRDPGDTEAAIIKVATGRTGIGAGAGGLAVAAGSSRGYGIEPGLGASRYCEKESGL